MITNFACISNCLTTHFKITYMEYRYRAFNLHRKYLYFDQDDYKIGERLSI